MFDRARKALEDRVMTAEIEYVTVRSRAEMDSAVTTYIAHGYDVADRGANSVTMSLKAEEFNLVFFAILLVLLIIPGLLYLIASFFARDYVVVIQLSEEARRPTGNDLERVDDLHRRGILDDDAYAAAIDRLGAGRKTAS